METIAWVLEAVAANGANKNASDINTRIALRTLFVISNDIRSLLTSGGNISRSLFTIR